MRGTPRTYASPSAASSAFRPSRRLTRGRPTAVGSPRRSDLGPAPAAPDPPHSFCGKGGEGTMRRSRSKGRRIVAALAATVVAALALSAGAPAQALPNQVTGLTVTQDEGFATLAWTPVAGATDYQIERATVNPATGVVGPGHDRRRLAATAQHHAAVSEVRRGRVRARRALPVARSRTVRDDASAVLGPRRRHDPPAVGDGPRSRPADAVGDQRQRDVHDVRQRARSTPVPWTPRATACAWWSSAARTPSRAERPPPGTARSTC